MTVRAVLKITIQREATGRYPIVAELTSSVGPEKRAEGRWEYDRVELIGLLQPLAYGTLLGRGVFGGDVGRLLARALGEFERVHVLLFVEAVELRELRWERLCGPFDGDRWDFLARNPHTPLSIHLPSRADRRFQPFGRRDLRALVLVASPPGLERYGFTSFDAAAALRTVRDGLGDIPCDCLWDGPGALGRPTLRALGERLIATRYTLLHVVCHGVFAGRDAPQRGDRRRAATEPPPLARGETAILIEGDDGRVERVEAERLIALLQTVEHLPHFAFLATCESADPRAEGALGGLAHRLVRDLGMPAVLAMTEKISQATALEMGRAFYPRLREHGEVDLALAETLARVGERFDAAVPALFSRLGGHPLFSDDLDRPPTPHELGLALRDLAALVPARAPGLRDRFEALSARVTPLLDPAGLGRDAQRDRDEALAQLDALCEEVADISLSALALGTPPPPYEPVCPFQGLRAFKVEDHRFFFGRDALVDRMEQALRAAPFLAVVGPSGSGKSSLVAAGLVPRLRRDRPDLKAILMVPSSRPMVRLERALAGAGLEEALARADATRTRVQGREPLLAAGPPAPGLGAVLVVDQLEEAFTHCASADERAEFFADLLALTRELPVVVTLRADFLDEVAAHAELHRAIGEHRIAVEAMTAPEMEAAIRRQVEAAGLRLGGDLMATLLEHVKLEPGAMPLVQHALHELWRRRHGRWLRSDEYRAIEGIAGAIATTVEEIYARQDDRDRERMRRIFTRLTHIDVDAAPGAERRDRRRRVAIAELIPAGEPPEPTRRLIDVLAEHRLLVVAVSPQTGRETAEVSHEALIRRWPRLQAWIGEDLEALRRIHQIQEAARAWDGAGRRADLLVHGEARLTEAEALAASGRFSLNQLEADYLKACVEERAAARARELESTRRALEAERERVRDQERQARRIRKRSRIIAALGLLAVAAAVASGFLYVRAERALQQVAEKQRLADAAEKKAEVTEVAAHDAELIAAIDRLGADSTRKGLVLREVESLGEDRRWQQHLIFTANEARAMSGFDRPSPFAKQSPAPGRTGIVLDARGERLLSLGQAGDLSLRGVRGPALLWTAAPAAGGAPRAAALVPSPAGDGAFLLGDTPGFQAILDVRSPPIPIPLADIFDVDVRAGRPRALVALAGGSPCPLALVDVDVSAGTADTRCLLAGEPALAAALLVPVADAALAVTRRGDAALLPLSGGPALGKLGGARAASGARAGRERAVLRVARNEAGTRVVLVTPEQVEVWGVAPAGRAELLEGSGRSFGHHPRIWGVLVDGDVPFVVDPEGIVWALEGGQWTIAAEFPPVPPRRPAQPLVHGAAARALVVATGPKLWVFDLAARRLRSMHGHTTSVTEVVVSADGRRFASADLEAVRVWDLDEELGVMRWLAAWNPPLRLLDVAGDGRRILVGAGGAAFVARLDSRHAPDVIAREHVRDARFLPDGIAVAVRTDAGAGVWLPAGGLRVGPADAAWDPARVFADPARVFVDGDVVWGIQGDGRAFAGAPPGGPVSGGMFSPGGEHLLLWRRGDDGVERAALLSRGGAASELLAGPGPLAGLRVGEFAWSPDGARLLATYAEEDRACAVHWPPDDPAALRRICVPAAEIPGAGASPDPLERYALRGAAWSPDSTRIALVLGDGNLLLDAFGDDPPAWFETWSERWERAALRFGPRNDYLVETTRSGVYVWTLDRRITTPIKLVDFEASDPPDALATLPLDGGRGLLTLSLRDGDLGMVLAARRWHIDAAAAEAALTTDSPFCLEPGWRRANLHEDATRARARYCACRTVLQIPDDDCKVVPGE